MERNITAPQLPVPWQVEKNIQRNCITGGKKVLSTVESELLHCEKFAISVAFITMGGITPLLQTLKELEHRGVKGKILTTNYLNFSDPRAIRKLHELSNIEIRMYMADEDEGFHTKGYIFKNEEIYPYASAFAMREENPRRVLFILHREQIAKQAIKSCKPGASGARGGKVAGPRAS